jgi:HupE / UreJ protein
LSARAAASIAAAVALALLAVPAAAHEVGLSRGEYVVEGAAVRAEVTFARRELINLVAGLDADHDGALTRAELAAARGAIEGALIGRIKVKGDGAPCPGAIESADLAEQDGVAIRAVYRCAARPKQLGVELGFLEDLPFGHRHLARATAGAAMTDQVLSQRSPSLTLDVPAEAAAPAPAPADGPSGAASPFQRGALYALTRYEGPAFLLALIASCADRRAALAASAAFVAAAAAGLALGARGLFTPSPLVLGPAIALSLVYVGLDAAASPAGRRRWLVALPFGVVHGLGGAAALGGAGASGGLAAGAGAVAALVAVSAAILVLSTWARRQAALPAWGLRALGAVIAASGVASGAIELVLGRT